MHGTRSATASLLALTLAVPPTPAKSEQNPSPTTIRVTSRLVLVDAVVSDSRSNPVTGLTTEDFELLEDGKPQRISDFSFEDRRKAASKPPDTLPAYVFTNRPEYLAPAAPLTILFLDGLNTPVTDYAYARAQAIDYLQRFRKEDAATALFVYGGGLNLVQNFTKDYDKLQKAAALKGAQPTQQLQLENQSTQIRLDFGADASQQAQALLANVRGTLGRVEERSHADLETQRVLDTIAALKSIARAVGPYPGRKRLIWISAGFPFAFRPATNDDKYLYRSYEPEIRVLTAALTEAQVAVYPVDARGLEGNVQGSGENPSRRDLGRASSLRFDTQASMLELAEATGGRAFINRNDIAESINEGAQDGEVYYGIGYVPANKTWDGKYRKIQLKVKRLGATVRYRRGYFATDPAKARDPRLVESAQMRYLLADERLLATQVTFKARVLPPMGANGVVKIEFQVDTNTLECDETTTGGLRCNVGFYAVASPKGRNVEPTIENSDAKLLDSDVNKEAAQVITREGFPFDLKLTLKPGEYTLHLGVRDLKTGRAGTLHVPVTVPEAP